VRRRLWLVVAMLSGLALVLGGCSALSSLLSTRDGLRNAGYQSVSVKPSGNDLDTTVTVNALPSQDDVHGVAGVVWNDFHERFDNLNITVHGQGQTLRQSLSFDEVQQMFGPRNPAWNRTTITGATKQLGFVVLGVVAVVVVIVVVIIVLVVRRKRRRRPQPPWTPYPPYGQPGYGGMPGPYGPPPAAGPTYGAPPYYPPPSEPPLPERPNDGNWGTPPESR
jgi:hypothetical protein